MEKDTSPKNNLTETDIREIAAQLRMPAGEKGVEMGHIMNEANVAMIDHTLDTLQPIKGDKILEIGHGNAHHLKKLLNHTTFPQLFAFLLDKTSMPHVDSSTGNKEMAVVDSKD